MRYEFRFRINKVHRPFLLNWVKLNLIPHPFFPSYKVMSLYYKRRIHEKTVGEKIDYSEEQIRRRLRAYDNLTDTNYKFFAETKAHMGGNERIKERVELNVKKEEDTDLIHSLINKSGYSIFKKRCQAPFSYLLRKIKSSLISLSENLRGSLRGK